VRRDQRWSEWSRETAMTAESPDLAAAKRLPQVPGEHGPVCEYEGVMFSDGTTVINWRALYGAPLIWDSFDDFQRAEAITGVVVS
jgi:hypothetical protein